MQGTHSSYAWYRNNYYSNFHSVIYYSGNNNGSVVSPKDNTTGMSGGYYGNTYTDFKNVYNGTSSIEVLAE